MFLLHRGRANPSRIALRQRRSSASVAHATDAPRPSRALLLAQGAVSDGAPRRESFPHQGIAVACTLKALSIVGLSPLPVHHLVQATTGPPIKAADKLLDVFSSLVTLCYCIPRSIECISESCLAIELPSFMSPQMPLHLAPKVLYGREIWGVGRPIVEKVGCH